MAATNRRRIFQLVQIIILIGLIWYLLQTGKIDFKLLSSIFTLEKTPSTIVVLLLVFANQVVISFRLVFLARNFNVSLGIVDSFMLNMVGLFFNNFLPGNAGGDIVKILLFRNMSQISYTKSFTIIMLDRFLGLLGLALLGAVDVVGLGVWAQMTHNIVSGDTILWGLLVSAIPFVVLCGLLLLRFEKVFTIVRKILSRFSLPAQFSTLLNHLQQFSNRRKVLATGVGFSVLGHLMAIMGVAWLTFTSLGVRQALVAFLASPIIMMGSVIPVTPGGIGWTEALAEVTWRLMNVEGGATVFVLWRVMVAALSLVGGILYLRFMAIGYVSDKK